MDKYCDKIKIIDNASRLQSENGFEYEEETDALYRRKKTNTRKSLAPLFVYLILREHSNAENKLTQQKIIELLKAEPYEIEIERKAVSRIIHNLTDSEIGIYSDSHTGTWYGESC